MTKPKPEFKADEIEPCVHCSAPAEKLGMVSTHGVRHTGPICSSSDHWVFCHECKASGPIEGSREVAVASWNHGRKVRR
jgi:hypothetical protein